MNSGKVKLLQEMLPRLLGEGHRVLLFSQFTQVLDLLEAVMNTLKIRYLKLTGSTNVAERQGLVDEYNQQKDIGVFLLSTRAGGLGLEFPNQSFRLLILSSFTTWTLYVYCLSWRAGADVVAEPSQRQASGR